ncbi:trimeric intracellular cation channel family protein [Nonomuraea angiospora]|uniref:trimeric intracellular cation channel family protein n=1 Tax=Nonomuraea angiospora TaxID=46172 RepID=UPI0029A34ABC|nr:TRIC cation channel family protein [Nonomuraea angiospora]MDX3108796.1 TRIC cation channel family protein [Nonomuraea angiospora]
MRVETITTVLDLVGVFINGLLGGSVARRRELDLFGYVVIGVVSGLGGGLIRDVLLQHGPPLALTNPLYIPIALAGAGVAFLLKFTERDWNRLFYVLDAIALCVWAAAGAQRTLAVGLGWLPAILLGTATAVGGGATRDLLVQRVPAVFGGNGLYASVAAMVAALQVICSALGAPTVVGTSVGVVVGTALRLVAYRRGWELPGGLEWEARDVIGKAVHPPLRRDRRRGRRRDGDD